ncbi:MAG: single-stranded DNA-binding protein, partial [Mycobacterium sp.]
MTDADTTELELDAEPGTDAGPATPDGADAPEPAEDHLVAEGEIAGDYLEELLD